MGVGGGGVGGRNYEHACYLLLVYEVELRIVEQYNIYSYNGAPKLNTKNTGGATTTTTVLFRATSARCFAG